VTPDEVRRLIAEGESFTVEFKGEQRSPLNDAELVETVVCLANGEGGVLLIGVDDDGTVTGARPRHEAGITDPRRLTALIANRTRPSLSVRCSIVALPEGDVIAIQVDEAPTPVGTVDGRYVRRAIVGRGEPGCLPLHFHEMQAHLADRGVLDYAALTVVGASWDDLDPLEFERFRRLIRESGGQGDSALLSLPDLELAKSLGVVDANHAVRAIRAGALLLFGREEALRRHVPGHEVAFQVLTQTKVEVNDFVRWPLTRVVEDFLGRFRARNAEQEVLVGMVRVGVPLYPEASFREALANALVHRDYQRLGAIHVQWHSDRLEVSNPGGFPRGVTAENLLVAAPHPRNPILADAFKRMGVVERTGRGVDAIYEGQLRAGRGAPDYSRSSRDDVVVVLRDGPAPLDFVRLLVEHEREHGRLGLGELLLLNQARRSQRLDVPAVAAVIQHSESEAQALLERLVQRNLLVRRGSGASARYAFVPGLLRALGELKPDRRVRDVDREHAEEVLRYIGDHGRISRADAAALTGLDSSQAKRLLDRLTVQGVIRRAGVRRGTYYVVPAGVSEE
jgi:ATP-dependent DNA helicase RecG